MVAEIVSIDHPPWPEGHLFTDWTPKSKNEHYRVCIHPECKVVEIREAPKSG